MIKKSLDRNIWITPSEATEYIIFSAPMIRKKIIQILKKKYTEGIIRSVPLANNHQAYFINKHNIKQFSELTGLTLRQDAEKTNDWLDSNDIFELVYGKRNELITYIYKYKKNHPNAVQHKLLNGKKVICLHINNKEDFIKTYNLQVRTDKEWLSAYDLKKQFTTQYHTILKHIKTLAPRYPSEIQYSKHHSNMTLCVRYDFVNQFATLMNLLPYNQKNIKTENWLNADEIGITIHRDHHLILRNMRKLYAEHSPLVSLKLNTTRWVLCVHKQNLNKFLIQIGILTPNKTQTNQNIVSLYQTQR